MNVGYAEGLIEGFLEDLVEDARPGAEQVLEAFRLVIQDSSKNRRILSDLKIKLAGLLE